MNSKEKRYDDEADENEDDDRDLEEADARAQDLDDQDNYGSYPAWREP